jgi:hypothetical protein
VSFQGKRKKDWCFYRLKYIILLSSKVSQGLVLCFSSAHDWVREGGKASEIPLDISVLHNMRQFVKYSRLKQIALRVS